jgi:hypothetical protein
VRLICAVHASMSFLVENLVYYFQVGGGEINT